MVVAITAVGGNHGVGVRSEARTGGARTILLLVLTGAIFHGLLLPFVVEEVEVLSQTEDSNQRDDVLFVIFLSKGFQLLVHGAVDASGNFVGKASYTLSGVQG